MEKIYEDEYIDVHAIDEQGAGGANHIYHTNKKDSTVLLSATYFQNGAILDNGVNGTTNEAELAKVRHRLECFQEGPFPCDENAEALEHVIQAIQALEKRTKNRKKRGVEGKDKA